MNNLTVRSALKVAFVLAGLYCSASSHASAIVSIDEFFVDKNGSTVFLDTFSNNQTPSQETSKYNVHGAFPDGAEANGLLTLNSDWGAFTNNALGQLRQLLLATWRSNIDPNNPDSGLNIGSTIDVTGIFNLATPTGPLTNGYGIRVQDAVQNQSTPDVLVQLMVQYWEPVGQDVIRFLLQDFVNGTITTLGYVPFAPGSDDDQIKLRISRPATSNNDFYGAYAFGTSGSFDPFTTFATPGDLFVNNTDFVRAQFFAFTAVPEPATLALLGLGLAGLAASRRRKQ